jgi:hypothetical protein
MIHERVDGAGLDIDVRQAPACLACAAGQPRIILRGQAPAASDRYQISLRADRTIAALPERDPTLRR